MPDDAASAAPATAAIVGAAARHTDRGCAFPTSSKRTKTPIRLFVVRSTFAAPTLPLPDTRRIDAAEAQRDEQCEGNRAEKIGEQQNHPASMVLHEGLVAGPLGDR